MLSRTLFALALGSIVTAGCLDEGGEDADESPDDFATTDVARVGVQRGVDRAAAFTPHEARILANDHGVRWTGVYLGGACDAGSGWTRDAVRAIHAATQWSFMPIWVGQQSPAICGAHDLTFKRGELDGAAAAHRLRAFGWAPHQAIPIALDIEESTYEHSHAGATAYTHGFIHAIHAAGYRAYVYGSESAIEHFHDEHLAIDGAWIADWHYNAFHHNADPNNLHIGARFQDHDRAWQYAGDFHVAGVGDVDGDASDLPLAGNPD